jgi:hypothetical protein
MGRSERDDALCRSPATGCFDAEPIPRIHSDVVFAGRIASVPSAWIKILRPGCPDAPPHRPGGARRRRSLLIVMVAPARKP